MSPTALTIGNFDGVHLGHQALVARARGAAGAQGEVHVVTFDPHPSHVLRPDQPIQRLTTLERRVQALHEAGADRVDVLPTDADMLSMSPEAFVEASICPAGPDVIVEGPDFRFGRGRTGTVETLAQLGERFDWVVETIDPVEALLVDQHSVPVRSSAIRHLLVAGRVSDAACLLGRAWCIEGTVVAGDRRGREMNCPTANIDHGDLVLPGDGIYAGVATVASRRYPAAVSIGSKPTFNGSVRLCEAHLLDFDGPLDDYGWHLEVALLERLRDQIRFDTLEALAARIVRDCEDVRRVVEAQGGTLRRP